jgi:hypothetical protein
MMPGHFEEDVGESTHAERVVAGDRDVMLSTPERGQAEVASRLTGHFIAKSAKSPGQILAGQAAR